MPARLAVEKTPEVGPPAVAPPNLLPGWDRADSRTFLRAGSGSVIVHIALVIILIGVAQLPAPVYHEPRSDEPDLRKAVRLVAPPRELTQREPNRSKPAKEVNVESLLAKPQVTPSTAAPRTFKAPPAPRGPGRDLTAQKVPEPPRIETAAAPAIQLPAAGTPEAPPPRQQSEQKPRLAFETPGQYGTAPHAPLAARITQPRGTVEDAVKEVERGGGQGGVVVGDLDQTPSISELLHQNPTPGQVHSSLELLSDPHGVDFKPYLIRVLALVRRNWLAVIPESARLGRRGRVLLQFAVDRDGGVPKLVIATPSGTEALDRAAVAGISASVPLPPLPREYKGNQVRLQFAFSYNVK